MFVHRGLHTVRVGVSLLQDFETKYNRISKSNKHNSPTPTLHTPTPCHAHPYHRSQYRIPSQRLDRIPSLPQRLDLRPVLHAHPVPHHLTRHYESGAHKYALVDIAFSETDQARVRHQQDEAREQYQRRENRMHTQRRESEQGGIEEDVGEVRGCYGLAVRWWWW
jgi:hypothetical protein